jgi:hypothetical protein
MDLELIMHILLFAVIVGFIALELKLAAIAKILWDIKVSLERLPR